MKKTKFLKVFSSAMALSVILAGCSSGSSNSSTKKEASKPAVEFKESAKNEGSVVDKPLVVGILSDSALDTLYNPVFYLQSTEWAVLSHMVGGSAFPFDNFDRVKVDDKTEAVTFSLNKETKEGTLTVNEGVKWNNGQPLTADDIIATYELMGNPKYSENVRYEDSYEQIEGMKEYHEGNAEKISGLVKKDDKTVVIKYKEVLPALLWGSGFIANFLNAEQVKEASKDFTKFAEADLNKKPLSYGPYYLAEIVEGEGAVLKQNPHYFKKDQVKTKEIQFKRVTIAQASSVMKAGEVDLLEELTPEIWESAKEYKNGNILGIPGRYMSYVGFKLGKFDKEKKEVVVDPNAKAADVRVRQAFGYAVNWDDINAKIYKGLRFTPTGSGMYPPAVDYIHRKDAEGFKLDKEKAKKLLDEAGFKDTDNDGLRENAKGEKVKFKFAIRNTGQSFDQALAEYFLKSWKEVGLDVELTDGKLMAPKDWSQRVQADDPEIDIFQGAWGLGTDPNPTALVGGKSQLNLQRYIDDNIKADLAKMGTKEMFDDNKLIETYRSFDKNFANARSWLPFSWKMDMIWVNGRVKDFDYKKYNKGTQKIYSLELTADKGKQG